MGQSHSSVRRHDVLDFISTFALFLGVVSCSDDTVLGRGAFTGSAEGGEASTAVVSSDGGGAVSDDPSDHVSASSGGAGAQLAGSGGKRPDEATGGNRAVTPDPSQAGSSSDPTASTGGSTQQQSPTGGSGGSALPTGGTGSVPTSDSGGMAGAAGSTYHEGGRVTLTARVGELSDGTRAIVGEWYNGTDQTIFLRGCDTTDAEYRDESDQWTSYGAFNQCTVEPAATELAPGATYPAGGVPPERGTVVWRLVGEYGVDCETGALFSDAGCAKTSSVTSNEVTWPE